jgi:hypothetical protein
MRLAHKLPVYARHATFRLLFAVRRGYSPGSSYYEESIMAQHRSHRVAEYDREENRPTRTSRTSSVVITLVVLAFLILLAIILF